MQIIPSIMLSGVFAVATFLLMGAATNAQNFLIRSPAKENLAKQALMRYESTTTTMMMMATSSVVEEDDPDNSSVSEFYSPDQAQSIGKVEGINRVDDSENDDVNNQSVMEEGNDDIDKEHYNNNEIDDQLDVGIYYSSNDFANRLLTSKKNKKNKNTKNSKHTKNNNNDIENNNPFKSKCNHRVFEGVWRYTSNVCGNAFEVDVSCAVGGNTEGMGSDEICKYNEQVIEYANECDGRLDSCSVGGHFVGSKEAVVYYETTGECVLQHFELDQDVCSLYDDKGGLGLKAMINVKDNSNKMYILFSYNGGLLYYNSHDAREATRYKGSPFTHIRRNLLDTTTINEMKETREQCSACGFGSFEDEGLDFNDLASNSNTPLADPLQLSHGTVKQLVIPFLYPESNSEVPEFLGTNTPIPKQDMENLLGRIQGAYDEYSWGQLNIESTLVDVVQLPQKYTESYTKANINEVYAIILDIVDQRGGFNISSFDNNNDGFVDMLAFLNHGTKIGAGKGQFRPDWNSFDKRTKARDHVTCYAYNSYGKPDEKFSQVALMQPFVHELGHMLYYPDLYDNTGGKGIGLYSIMAAGKLEQLNTPGHPSMFEKLISKWTLPIWPAQGKNWIEATQIQDNQYPKVYKIGDGAAGFKKGEYLLIENRQPINMDFNSPKGGLAIFHIDDNIMGNTIRAGYPGKEGWPENGKHYRVALLQADGEYHLDTKETDGGNEGDDFDLFREDGVNGIFPSTESTEFDLQMYPNTDSYQNGEIIITGVRIFNIGKAGNVMTFEYEENKEDSVIYYQDYQFFPVPGDEAVVCIPYKNTEQNIDSFAVDNETVCMNACIDSDKPVYNLKGNSECYCYTEEEIGSITMLEDDDWKMCSIMTMPSDGKIHVYTIDTVEKQALCTNGCTSTKTSTTVYVITCKRGSSDNWGNEYYKIGRDVGQIVFEGNYVRSTEAECMLQCTSMDAPVYSYWMYKNSEDEVHTIKCVCYTIEQYKNIGLTENEAKTCTTHMYKTVNSVAIAYVSDSCQQGISDNWGNEYKQIGREIGGIVFEGDYVTITEAECLMVCRTKDAPVYSHWVYDNDNFYGNKCVCYTKLQHDNLNVEVVSWTDGKTCTTKPVAIVYVSDSCQQGVSDNWGNEYKQIGREIGGIVFEGDYVTITEAECLMVCRTKDAPVYSYWVYDNDNFYGNKCVCYTKLQHDNLNVEVVSWTDGETCTTKPNENSDVMACISGFSQNFSDENVIEFGRDVGKVVYFDENFEDKTEVACRNVCKLKDAEVYNFQSLKNNQLYGQHCRCYSEVQLNSLTIIENSDYKMCRIKKRDSNGPIFVAGASAVSFREINLNRKFFFPTETLAPLTFPKYNGGGNKWAGLGLADCTADLGEGWVNIYGELACILHLEEMKVLGVDIHKDPNFIDHRFDRPSGCYVELVLGKLYGRYNSNSDGISNPGNALAEPLCTTA